MIGKNKIESEICKKFSIYCCSKYSVKKGIKQVTEKIIMALGIALLVSLVVGPFLIPVLRVLKFGQSIRMTDRKGISPRPVRRPSAG
jgi:hypothetical protein